MFLRGDIRVLVWINKSFSESLKRDYDSRHSCIEEHAEQCFEHIDGYRAGAMWLEQNGDDLTKVSALFRMSLSHLYEHYVTKILPNEEDESSEDDDHSGN